MFVHLCTLAFVRLCVFVYSLFIYPAERGVFLYLWPLQVQGWYAITKTALSITLTDRLKGGFNSDSSPWALHHRGRYPSTLAPLCLYRQLLSITRWLGKMASATPEERCCVLAYPSVCGLERYSNRRKSLIVGLKGLAACCLQGYHPTCSTKGAWWHFYEEVCLYNHIHAHCVLLVQLFSSVSADYPSLTWVALSIPITTCISTVSKQPSLKVPPPIHHPFQPQSSPSLQA